MQLCMYHLRRNQVIPHLQNFCDCSIKYGDNKFYPKKSSLNVRTEPETEKRGAEGPGRESDFGVFRFVSFISRIVPCAGLTPPLKRKFKIRKNNTARFLDNSDEIKFLGRDLIQFSRNCLVGYWGWIFIICGPLETKYKKP